jgi:hypothetical protein
VLGVEHAHHLIFLDYEYRRGNNRRGRPHPEFLARQASFSEKVRWPQDRHDCFFANFIHYRQFYAAFLNVHHARGGFTLSIDLLRLSKQRHSSRYTRGMEKSQCVERRFLLASSFEFLFTRTRDGSILLSLDTDFNKFLRFQHKFSPYSQ